MNETDNQKTLEEYVKYLLDQRTNLEFNIFKLTSELNELKKPKEDTSVEATS